MWCLHSSLQNSILSFCSQGHFQTCVAHIIFKTDSIRWREWIFWRVTRPRWSHLLIHLTGFTSRQWSWGRDIYTATALVVGGGEGFPDKFLPGGSTDPFRNQRSRMLCTTHRLVCCQQSPLWHLAIMSLYSEPCLCLEGLHSTQCFPHSFIQAITYPEVLTRLVAAYR